MRPLHKEADLSMPQREWARTLGNEPSKTTRGALSLIFLACTYLAPIGMTIRAVQPELLSPQMVNVINFASGLYILLLMLGAVVFVVLAAVIALGYHAELTGNEQKFTKGLYSILKGSAKQFTSGMRLAKMYLAWACMIVFLVSSIMVGWTLLSIFITFPCVVVIIGSTLARRRAVVKTLRRLTPELISDYESGKTEPTQTLIIEARPSK